MSSFTKNTSTHSLQQKAAIFHGPLLHFQGSIVFGFRKYPDSFLRVSRKNA